ncbi:MAG TPA: NAD(P)/FAD-dependent oxidoreductase [Candidatus Angelobacter sp.]|nr:NAD(P)/FAD-dependent oxidoreductase [Candidatus Angelobacter sp.]
MHSRDSKSAEQVFDVIILGAGAAGLMCAMEAGQRGRRVAVLDHADRIGKKILISGGGRCNFTNLHCRPENFLSANPHFCKSALARYTPADFIALVQKHRIPYHEKTLGQLFCDHSAHDIVNMLEQECRAAGVRIFTSARVQEVRHNAGFTVKTSAQEFCAPALVIATGGLSIPKMGATSFGYDLARQFGLAIVECRPALVPLTLNADDRKRYCDLSGVSTEVVATTTNSSPRFREKMLITHRGLSGPAILQISSYWKKSEPIVMDLAPEKDLTAPLRQPKARRDLASAKVAFHAALPVRLAERWLEQNPPVGWSNHALEELERRAHGWQIVPDGTEGYDKAEVTAGGVDTNELSAKTMESRKVPGLFFIGEVVDVTGHLGGFNFQWAWASGFSAGQAV